MVSVNFATLSAVLLVAHASRPDSGYCHGALIHFSSDNEHCGGCNLRCAVGSTAEGHPFGGYIEQCVNGRCTPCPPGQNGCSPYKYGVDRCVDFMNDNEHCGGCGKQCFEGSNCVEGECV